MAGSRSKHLPHHAGLSFLKDHNTHNIIKSNFHCFASKIGDNVRNSGYFGTLTGNDEWNDL